MFRKQRIWREPNSTVGGGAVVANEKKPTVRRIPSSLRIITTQSIVPF